MPEQSSVEVDFVRLVRTLLSQHQRGTDLRYTEWDELQAFAEVELEKAYKEGATPDILVLRQRWGSRLSHIKLLRRRCQEPGGEVEMVQAFQRWLDQAQGGESA